MNEIWTIDERLDQDSILVHRMNDLEIRLINDKRWPWIMVVPAFGDLKDLDDIAKERLPAIFELLHDLSGTLKDMGVCQSTNVATLSNVVTQLHWHIVGRSQGDPNWPAPVWGFEKPVPYGTEEADNFINDFRKAFRGTFV